LFVEKKLLYLWMNMSGFEPEHGTFSIVNILTKPVNVLLYTNVIESCLPSQQDDIIKGTMPQISHLPPP